MPERQYVRVQFNPWDRRSYTYHNDGQHVGQGEKVLVETSKGKVEVTVTGTDTKAPPYETKPILGPAPAFQPPQASLL